MNKFTEKSIFLSLMFLLSLPMFGRSKRVGQIPNGSIKSCANCHINPNGGGAKNAFGKIVESKFLDSNGDVIWNEMLASIDSDGDGVSNGNELQDQFGIWRVGDSAPGIPSAVSSPGDENSTKLQIVSVHLSSMTPHVGEQLFIRAVDKSNGMEAFRNNIQSLTADETINLENLIAGHSYYIDFFADHNGNGFYDAPPADHSWRLDADNINGGETIEFAHNTNFTNINWKYQLTLNFSGMTPHVGEMLEFLVVDDSTSKEVGRMKIGSVPSAEFSKVLTGLMLNRAYTIKIYSDHNGNGLYDSPPTDHVWEMKFNNPNGNAIANFSHSIDFKDVGWNYLYSLNLLNMTPHIGEMLELRIVRKDNNEEVSRTKVEKIILPNFEVKVAGIEIGVDYDVDFYADHNGNGVYDVPPTDHAWRMSFTSNNGNLVENFSHNTSFVDIQWPNLTDVNDDIEGQLSEFALYQNYPNPFNPTTKISFNLKENSSVKLKVYNILGEVVANLINSNLSAGVHTIDFNAENLVSGTYIYRIESGNFIETKKMILLR